MKVRSLQQDSDSPACFLLKLRQTSLLIDCPLSWKCPPLVQEENVQDAPMDHVLFAFLREADSNENGGSESLGRKTDGKEVKQTTILFRGPDFTLVDVAAIDILLISNPDKALALPFLTEYTDFEGIIYATEPVIAYTRQIMQELVHWHTTRLEEDFDALARGSRMKRWISDWGPIYTKQDIESCIRKIIPVRYREELRSYNTMTLKAHSAGYCLGSAIWEIQVGYEKIVACSSCSLHDEYHPSNLDASVFENATAVIASDFGRPLWTQPPDISAPIPLESPLDVLCALIDWNIKGGRSVLIPMSTVGLIYDVLSRISSQVPSLATVNGKIYVISPQAQASMKHATIFGEWAQDAIKEKTLEGKPSFAHVTMMEEGARSLLTLPSTDYSVAGDTLKEPCVVLTGDHRSPLHGPLTWFLQQWSDPARYVCIFTDNNSYTPELVRLCRATSKIEVIEDPIEQKLTLPEFLSILSSLKVPPKHLVTTRDANSVAFHSSAPSKFHFLGANHIVKIPLDHAWDRTKLASKFAGTLVPSTQSNSLSMASMFKDKFVTKVQGVLTFRDDKPLLEQLKTHSEFEAVNLCNDRYLWGSSVDIDKLLRNLDKLGMSEDDLTIKADAYDHTTSIILPPDTPGYVRIWDLEPKTEVYASEERVRLLLMKAITLGLYEL